MQASVPTRPKRPHHMLAYLLSLPERLVRVLAALVGQLGLLAGRLVPGPLRKGRFYRLAVERQLRMLTDDLGHAGLFAPEQAITGDVAKRMAVGGVVDNLMTLGLHASPLWILLAASDVSQGAGAFVRELGDELEAGGFVESGARLQGVDRVLKGLSGLSDQLADTMDAPPLAVSELRETLGRVRSELEGVGATAISEVGEIDRLARSVTEVSDDVDRSLLETLGGLVAGTARGAGKVAVGGVLGAGAVLSIVSRRVYHDVLGDYGQAIGRMRRRGFYGSLRKLARPQSRSWATVFHYRFVTFIERGLSLGRWSEPPWRLPV